MAQEPGADASLCHGLAGLAEIVLTAADVLGDEGHRARARAAVALAARVRPKFLIPHHYDMFTFNTASIDEFRDEARRLPEGVAPRVLHCGERWEVRH